MKVPPSKAGNRALARTTPEYPPCLTQGGIFGASISTEQRQINERRKLWIIKSDNRADSRSKHSVPSQCLAGRRVLSPAGWRTEQGQRAVVVTNRTKWQQGMSWLRQVMTFLLPSPARVVLKGSTPELGKPPALAPQPLCCSVLGLAAGFACRPHTHMPLVHSFGSPHSLCMGAVFWSTETVFVKQAGSLEGKRREGWPQVSSCSSPVTKKARSPMCSLMSWLLHCFGVFC